MKGFFEALGAEGDLGPGEIVRGLRGRIAAVRNIGTGLLDAYREALGAGHP